MCSEKTSTGVRKLNDVPRLVSRKKPFRPVKRQAGPGEGHAKAETTRLATEIAAAVTRITGIPVEQVLVVFKAAQQVSPSKAGRVLPEPGEEEAWIAGS
jgi:hypothetical protein